jgi:hypothetical protein
MLGDAGRYLFHDVIELAIRSPVKASVEGWPPRVRSLRLAGPLYFELVQNIAKEQAQSLDLDP